MPARKQLGQILLEAGVLDEYQLKAALGYQKRWGGRLGKILVENRFITEKALVEAIHKQTGVEKIDLTRLEVPDYLVRLVPLELASRHMVVPVRLEGEAGKPSETLFVAMADPTNLEALDEIRFRTGKRTRPLLAAESEIEMAIRRIYMKEPFGQSPMTALADEEGEIIEGRLEQSPAAIPQSDSAKKLEIEDPFAFLESAQTVVQNAADLPEIEVVDVLEVDSAQSVASSVSPPPSPTNVKTESPGNDTPVARVGNLQTQSLKIQPPEKPVAKTSEIKQDGELARRRESEKISPDHKADQTGMVAESRADRQQIEQVVSELESKLGAILERLTSAESPEELPSLMKPSHIVAALVRLLLQKKVFTIEEFLKELEKQ